MRLIDLKLAASEIKQAVEGAEKRDRTSPFFFMVGAGISHPPIPLAAEIQGHCRKVAIDYDRASDAPVKQPASEYSHWFAQAYPQPGQRQEYLRDLIEKKFISRANFRLAHLLLMSTISNLVVTTNFDDFLSRALTLFGKHHILCDHPNTVERIDLQAADIQILHVHGSYSFYDCCNLTDEVQRRAKPSSVTSFTVAQTLDDILRSHSPIVVGYSGWEDDVFMSALKRRLSNGLRTNLYWFCFRRLDADALPGWLQSQPNVCAVVPPEPSVTPPARTPENTGKPSLGEKEELLSEASTGLVAVSKIAEPVQTATAVFDEFIRSFGVHLPNLTQDPLGFFAEQLRSSLLGDRPDEIEDDVYSIRGVIDRVLNAKGLQQAAPESDIDAYLERLRDASRRSNYGAALGLTEAIPKEKLSVAQVREVMLAMVQAGSGFWDDSDKRIRSYDIVASLADQLKKLDAADTAVLTELATALYNKGLTLYALGRSEEELAVYEEIIHRFNDSIELELQQKVAEALFNRAVTLGSLNRREDEIAVYDEVVRRFGGSSDVPLDEQVAKALVNKGFRLRNLDRDEEAIAVYNDVVRRFGDSSDLALQEQVAKALVNKGVPLGNLDRDEEAIGVWDDVVRRFGDSSATALLEQVGSALLNKGVGLGSLDRSEEAIAVYDEVIRRFGDSSETALQEQMARALINKGIRLGALNRGEEAIAVYDEVMRRFGDSSETALQEQVARALINKGDELEELSRSGEAAEAFQDVARRFGKSSEPALQELVTRAKAKPKTPSA